MTTTEETRSKKDTTKSDPVIAFEKLFPVGKQYESVSDLRTEIAKYGLKYNIVMSTKNSNGRSIHLWCKHAGTYRNNKLRFKKAKLGQRPSSTTKVVQPRKKETQRTNCGCYIKAKIIKEAWTIEKSCGEHNHPIPEKLTVYSIHRKQSDEVKEIIFKLFEQGHKTKSVLAHCKAKGIENIIKKDVENLQQQFRKRNMSSQASSTTPELKVEEEKLTHLLVSDEESQQESEQEEITYIEESNTISQDEQQPDVDKSNSISEDDEPQTVVGAIVTTQLQLRSSKLSKNNDIPQVENTPLNNKRTSSRKRKVTSIDNEVESVQIISP